MTPFRLAVAAAAVAACAYATPSFAGGNNDLGWYYPQTPPRYHHNTLRADDRREDRAQRYGMTYEELRRQQIRNECQMFAFQYWRYHPEWQHCGYN